jgi:antirestriction protein ArdC
MKTNTQPNFQDILKEAVSKPGKLLKAYSAFHSYSFGNVMLAWSQCMAREIPLGPIATFKQWESKGRRVKKGEKALQLCMPVSFKKEVELDTGETEEQFRNFFVYRNRWFVLSQTEGDEAKIDSLPNWNESTALQTLEIEKIEFKSTNGNAQGYASGRQVAINPVAQLPLKTLFHELGHILLGHTDRSEHAEVLPRNLKEAEAESVALLCLESLGLPGSEYCRGYIQNWFGNDEIPEKSCRKIFQAVDKILKAGRGEK